MKALKTLGLVLILLLAIPLSLNSLAYINFDPTYGFLRLKQDAVSSGYYLPAYYSHVLAASLILIIGIFQLNPTLGLRWRKAHQFLGKFYVAGILFISAPGALIMSFYINRGPFVFISFVIQSVLWFTFTFIAYQKIRSGNILSHKEWMFRSYSLTFAAITLRVYVFASSWFFDLGLPLSYAIIAWLSWVLNLIICELYLQISKVNFEAKVLRS